MRLTSEQSEELHQAVLQAFPARGDLARVVRHKLGESLDTITTGGSLSDTVFSLVTWLESRNRVVEFIIGARADNPGNEALRRFEERHCQVPTAPTTESPAAAVVARVFEEAFERETRRARRQIRSAIPGLNGPLPRSEIEWIEDQLRGSTPVLFTGDAGTGKSGVADALAESASRDGKALLLLDARRTAYVQNETQLRQHLDLTAPLVSAIEDVAQRRRCRLIIEQLDNSIGYPAAGVLIDLATDCCGIEGVETVVISRKREANEVALLQPLTRAGFKELTSYPLGVGEAQRVLERLSIADPSAELIELSRNLLNLELIGRIKQQQPDYDFSQVMAEVDLWEQYIETIVERERTLSNPQAANQVVAEAMRLAKLGLNREDRTFTLDYDINARQGRLISWEVILLEEGRRYRFRHEKLQDYLYAKDAAERTLMPTDVAAEINSFRTGNVIKWMDKIYQRSGSENTRRQFLMEAFNVGK